MIRHVLLDADGVLQLIRSGWHRPLSERLGDGAEAFYELLAADELPCLSGVGDFPAIARARFAERGLDVDFDELFGPFWTGIEPDPALLEAVDRLRTGGYAVHLASNQERHRGTHMRDVLGYGERFDSLQLSFELGVAKPEPEYFLRVLDRIGATAKQTVFVDDNAANVAAAQSVGIRSKQWHKLDSAEPFAEVLHALGVV